VGIPDNAVFWTLKHGTDDCKKVCMTGKETVIERAMQGLMKAV